MPRLKRLVKAKPLAAKLQRSAQIHRSAHRGRSTVPAYKRAARRQAADALAVADHLESAAHNCASIDYKGLIGFGLALATADSKGLVGLGRKPLRSNTSFILFELYRKSPLAKSEKIDENENTNFFDGRSLRLV